MICDKCGLDFEEKELDESHDIPKYMGGTDADGRHWLCKKCHEKYENEIVKFCCMLLISSSSEEVKRKCRLKAKIVKNYFFKKEVKDGEQK